jgi:Rrf2 family protein
MQLTRAADYGVRVMIHLAMLPPGSRSTGAALALAGDIPPQFVLKVLQALARARLIESHRGTGGGFALALDPERITMLDVIEAIEGPTGLNLCLGPNSCCDRRTWCPAHRVWVEAQAALTGVLRRATIASLAEQAAVEVGWNSPG